MKPGQRKSDNGDWVYFLVHKINLIRPASHIGSETVGRASCSRAYKDLLHKKERERDMTDTTQNTVSAANKSATNTKNEE
jgi:hypothetical protein